MLAEIFMLRLEALRTREPLPHQDSSDAGFLPIKPSLAAIAGLREQVAGAESSPRSAFPF